MEASSYDGAYDSATNWRIAGGSLVDSIAFESSFSSAAAERDGLDETASAAVTPAAKSPILLLPPLPDCDPCEITITFAQQHEVRQVYVRSTARVYEIYYTTRPRRSSEYLCTVRCGVAQRDEEVLQTPLFEAAASVNPAEPIKDPKRRRAKDNGNGGTDEDDWVEVKASDASLLNNGKNLLAKPHGRTQDLYEATAEINDAEPCISITLRLLSLQEKGCLFVDEVYIFADPANPTGSQQEASGAGNLAGNMLMAMFMPTLLSRAKDVSREPDKQTSDEHESKTIETWRNSNDSAKIMNQIQQEAELSKADYQEVNLPVVIDATSKPPELETSRQISGAESKPPSSCNHVEIILHNLVSRVSRIEDILTRFEDQLLKPINRIDARLQQVEQKLEGLAKKSDNFEGLAGTRIVEPDFPGSDTGTNQCIETDEPSEKSQNVHFPSCTRMVAPEFPCGDVEPDSSYSNRCEDYNDEPPDLKGDDMYLPNSSDNIVDPQSVSHSFPGTDVTATESGIGDDKEGGHSLGRESSEEKPKHSLSINDALASALAGFLSSTLTKDIKYSQALVVTAPEFLNGEDGENDEKTLMDTHLDESQTASACLTVAEEPICMKDVEDKSTLALSVSAQNEPGVTASIEDYSYEMVNGVAKKFGHDEAGYNGASSVVTDSNANLGEGTVANTESNRFTEVTEKEEANQETTKDPVSEPENPNLSTGSLSSGFVTAARGREEPKINDVLQSVLGFQHTSPSVDFKTPVLDVKFNPEQTSENKSFFQAVLGDSSESVAESVTARDCIDDSHHQNLISVDDVELTGPPTDTLASVDMDYYDISYMHLKLEGETQPDSHGSSNEEMPTASLI